MSKQDTVVVHRTGNDRIDRFLVPGVATKELALELTAPEWDAVDALFSAVPAVKQLTREAVQVMTAADMDVIEAKVDWEIAKEDVAFDGVDEEEPEPVPGTNMVLHAESVRFSRDRNPEKVQLILKIGAGGRKFWMPLSDEIIDIVKEFYAERQKARGAEPVLLTGQGDDADMLHPAPHDGGPGDDSDDENSDTVDQFAGVPDISDLSVEELEAMPHEQVMQVLAKSDADLARQSREIDDIGHETLASQFALSVEDDLEQVHMMMTDWLNNTMVIPLHDTIIEAILSFDAARQASRNGQKFRWKADDHIVRIERRWVDEHGNPVSDPTDDGVAGAESEPASSRRW